METEFRISFFPRPYQETLSGISFALCRDWMGSIFGVKRVIRVGKKNNMLWVGQHILLRALGMQMEMEGETLFTSSFILA